MEGRLTPVLGLTKPATSSRLDAGVVNGHVRVLCDDLDILDAAIGELAGGGGGGITEAEADARYVRFVGGSVMTGALTPEDDFGCDLGSALRRYDTFHASAVRLRTDIGINPPNTAAPNPLHISVGSEAFARLQVAPDGTLRWGSGTATQDTTLGRTGAAALTLTGSLATTGALTVASRAVAASPDAGNGLSWNTNGFYVPAGAAPTGPAGGDLSGTYPNPQIAAGVITDADVAAANKDGTAATASLRTLGSGASQAAAGDHAHAGLIPASVVDARGDLLVGSAADAVARVAVGANGTVLSADSTAATGVAWSAPAATAFLLVNPGLEVWQRGAGAYTLDGALGADGWENLVNAGTISVVRNTADADAGSVYCAALTAASSPNVHLRQKMEDYAQLRGRTVAFAVRVKCATASAVRLSVWDSVNGYRYSAYHTGGGSYETLSVTAAIAGTATGVYVGVNLVLAATAYADNAVLVVGSVAPSYAPLHPADEWARCLRYYQEIGGLDNNEYAGAGQCTSTTQAVVPFRLPVEMANAPTVAVSAAADWQVSNAAGTAVACTALAASLVTRKDGRLIATVASGLVAGDATTLRAAGTANARIRFESRP